MFTKQVLDFAGKVFGRLRFATAGSGMLADLLVAGDYRELPGADSLFNVFADEKIGAQIMAVMGPSVSERKSLPGIFFPSTKTI